jgi:hypothetical protein
VLKHTFVVRLITADLSKLDGFTPKWRFLVPCMTFSLDDESNFGSMDNIGGGVARLDIVVHVLDIVVREGGVFMEMLHTIQ